MINDTNEQTTVGQRIRLAREKEGLTQSELATKLQYNSSTAVSLIESDERSVKVETLQRIAEILHQDVNYLATGKETPRDVRTALRADSNFSKDDIKRVEDYIEFLMSQKKNNGRGSK